MNMTMLLQRSSSQVSVLIWLKPNVKSAFRILLINPQDYHLLGIKWSAHYYYDKCMPKGCSSSCKTFETFSTVVEWIAQDKLGIANLIHLLDVVR